ncbi:hypothetical protein Goari_011518 [Gossypium aridum]|uniref:PB1-like domain-containing protein n=1 Tax=Gossypium aridum TaxID=34290 RepID=A0A7J8WXK9_GOSAI|nr:hypothetical protein [Gossypium aridum]
MFNISTSYCFYLLLLITLVGMSVEEEYYINLYVGGKFVRDPYVRYLSGAMVRLKEGPDTISYFELCKIVKDELGFNTVQLIYFHVPRSRTLQDNLRVV